MKTVLITGGSRGIGRSMVEIFSKNGYLVAFTYKNSDKEADDLARSTGAIPIKADSLSEEDVKRGVAYALSKLGKIDCLINNAGISSFSLLTDLSLEEWNNTIGVSLTGAFLYSKAVIPDMLSRKAGRIINVTSMWGIVGSSCEVHYSAAKAGLIGMTKALAKELGPSGITVNAIAPGLIETEMNASLTEEEKKSIVDETPLMKMGSPEDVAKAALFLASNEASFITGDVLNLSGGFIV